MGGGGDSWSYKTCKTLVSLIITTNKPTPSFLQDRYPSVAQSTVSEQGKEKVLHSIDLLTSSSPGVFIIFLNTEGFISYLGRMIANTLVNSATPVPYP